LKISEFVAAQCEGTPMNGQNSGNPEILQLTMAEQSGAGGTEV